MVNRYSALLCTLSVFTCLHSSTQAQNFSKKNRYRTVGVSLNALNYFGDISPNVRSSSMRLGATRPGLSVRASQRISPRFSANVALSYGRVSGKDSEAGKDRDLSSQIRYQRNINFRNDIVELATTAAFDLIENRGDQLHRPDFAPYVFAGVAFFHHSPKGLVGGGTVPAGLSNGDYVALQPLRTEGQASGYRRMQISIPFGAGLRYRLNKEFDLGLEVGWRKTFTDYLDDVSGKYAPQAKLTSPAALYFGHDVTRTTGTTEQANFASPGQIRGHNTSDDWYIVTAFSVNYMIPQKLPGFKFR